MRLVLPGAIDTEIWDQPGNDPPLYDGAARAARDRRPTPSPTRSRATVFELYVPDMQGIVEFKTADIDAFLASRRPTCDEAVG